MDGNLSFEQRWQTLLNDCATKLSSLTSTSSSDVRVKELWVDINRFVTIMAIPKGVRSSMRKTLWQMARQSSWKQALTIVLYLIFTFLPRHTYRNTDTQRWFKRRLGNL